jgi:site-specific recombinase XerD
MDLTQHITRFNEHLVALGRSTSTVKSHHLTLVAADHFFRGRGCLRAADLRPDDIDAYLLSLRERGLAWGSVVAQACILRNLGRWLAQAGLVLADPTLGIELDPDDEPLLAPPLSEAQVAVLLDAIPLRGAVDLRNRAFLELLYGAGLRLSEALGVTIHDLNRQGQVLLVTGKSGHQRELPLLTGTVAALEDYFVLRRELLQGPDLDLLFLSSKTGRRMSMCGVEQWLGRLGRRVLGVRVHPHALRHAAAVHLLRGGMDIRYIQAFLGHENLDTTKTYLRLVPGHLREDYDRAMPSLVGPPPGLASPPMPTTVPQP